MAAGLITLALVGMLQALGALADTLPVDPAWLSDAAGEDECGHAALRASSPDAVGAAAIDLPYRAEPTLDAIDCTTAPAARVRLRSHESRAPPALLAHASA